MTHAKSMPGYQDNPSSRFTPTQQKLLDRVVGKRWRLLEAGSARDNRLLDEVVAAYAQLDEVTRKARRSAQVKTSPPSTAQDTSQRKGPAKRKASAKPPRPTPTPKPERKPRAPSIPDSQYQAMVARLREWFVGFDAQDGFRVGKALTAYQKRKVRDYSRHLEAFFIVLRDQPPLQRRDFDTMSEAQVARQYTPEIPYRRDMKSFAMIYVPGGDDSARVWIDGRGHMHIREGDIEQIFIPFTTEEMLNPEYVADRVTSMYPKAISYHLRAGQYGVARNGPGSYSPREAGRDGIIGMIRIKQQIYSAAEYDPQDPNSSYFSNWMTGIIVYVVHNCKGRGCRDKYRAFIQLIRQNSDKRARRGVKRASLERIRKKGRS